MSQVKIYALDTTIERVRAALSDAIHAAVTSALDYPPDKRFHRFIRLAREDFIHPPDRSDDYLVIEISMFEGRSVSAKKALVRALFANIASACGIAPQDVEITLTETPRVNWGIRGLPGDELGLNYKVDV